MVQQKSPSIFNLKGEILNMSLLPRYFWVPVFFRFKNPMARVQADSHFGAGRFIGYSTAFGCDGTIGHWGIYLQFSQLFELAMTTNMSEIFIESYSPEN